MMSRVWQPDDVAEQLQFAIGTSALGLMLLTYDAAYEKRKHCVNWLSNLISHTPDCTSPAWEEDALFLDVRTPGEYASGHVQGALNLPLDRFVQDYASVAPDKLKQIVLYCHSGARSGQATQFLCQQNYQNVVNGGSVGLVALKTSRPIRRH